MSQHYLPPIIREVLSTIRQNRRVEDVVGLILEKACAIAHATHGSFVLIDHTAQRLTIAHVFGSDWTLEKRLCQLAVGQGLTGKVAASGQPLLCRDTAIDPDYFPLFDYVRSELVVPVIVHERVWGVINIDGPTPGAFDDSTLNLLTLFAELAAFAITMRLDHAEQENVQHRLFQSEKLASLGEALAGIAHEINNPLTAILGYASLLDFSLDEATNRASTEIITAEAQRAADLIRGLLEFSRKETGKRELVDVHTIVKQVVALKQHQLKLGNVKLQVSRAVGSCPTFVCPQQIKQVLLNLITNAEQAFPPGQTDRVIHIHVGSHRGEVTIVVADNGAGIPEEARPHIFDPFFTTKPPGEGTGLGLAIAHSIMEAHSGRIVLTSTTAAGTAFTLSLPSAEARDDNVVPLPPSRAAAKSSPTTFAGHLLLVDDEPAILESLAAYLGMLDLTVCRAQSGQAALEMLRTESFDLVLTDIRMSGLDGIKLYYAACQYQPQYEKRFVFMSGYQMRDSVKSVLTATGLPCLEKPFSFDELRRTLAPLLGQRMVKHAAFEPITHPRAS